MHEKTTIGLDTIARMIDGSDHIENSVEMTNNNLDSLGHH